jgi:hypothetical protein
MQRHVMSCDAMHGDPGLLGLTQNGLAVLFFPSLCWAEGGREESVQADGFRGCWSVLGRPVAWLGGYGKLSARNWAVDWGDSDVGDMVLLD